jgi:histidyl-tRNA synthetase
MEFLKAPQGMLDLSPAYHNYFNFLKKVYRHEFRKNGFRRISTPLIEHETLYQRILWEKFCSDLLYKCETKDQHNLVLRPEAAIGTMRAYIESGFSNELQPVYLYHIDRYFRKNSLGVGDLKQFYQIGAEIIWESDPILDAQQIYMNVDALNQIGLAGKFSVQINTLWNKKELEKYREELKAFYDNKTHLLTESSKALIWEDPLLLFDTENEDEKILASQAPSMQKFLKKDSKEHYTTFKEYLDIFWVKYQENHMLTHKLKYYTDIVWKIVYTETGENIVVGGRYDSLAKSLWSPDDIPATGFAVRVEFLIELLQKLDIKIRNKDKIDLYFVQLWEEAKKAVLPLSLEARNRWINTLASLGTPSIKEQMLKAQRIGAKFVVIVGVMEARNGRFQVRNYENWKQEEVKKEELIDYVIERIWKESLDFYQPARDLIIPEGI